MTRTKSCLLLALAVLLGSCSFLTDDTGIFQDRRGEYQNAPVMPEMRVPNNLDSYTLDQLYVVPEEVVASNQDFVANVPKPKPLESNRPEGVVIRRYAGENWIVIAASPGQVWPRVRDFWIQAGVSLVYENPVEGIMETDWLNSSAVSGNRDKYRIRIEPGLHAGSSEVFALQISRPRDAISSEMVVWPAVSESEDQEFEILQQVSQYLADRTDIYSSSSSSLLAGSLAGERKANLLETSANGPALELQISLSRAWAQVGQALERAEVQILERNRDGQSFNVVYTGVESGNNSPGFFSRVFRDNGDDIPEFPFVIRLEETDSGILVLAESDDGSGADRRLQDELLQLILSNLG